MRRSLEKIAGLSMQFAMTSNRRVGFQKRSQLLIGSHDATLSITAMGVSNPDCSPLRIYG